MMKNCSRDAGEPELIDQLILGLGLGSSGQQITPSFRLRPINQTIPDSITGSSRGKRSNCGAQQICHHVTTPHSKAQWIIVAIANKPSIM